MGFFMLDDVVKQNFLVVATITDEVKKLAVQALMFTDNLDLTFKITQSDQSTYYQNTWDTVQWRVNFQSSTLGLNVNTK